MKALSKIFVLALVLNFTVLVPNSFPQNNPPEQTNKIGFTWWSSEPPQYINYTRGESVRMYNEEWNNDPVDTAQVFTQSGIPAIVNGEREKGGDFEWFQMVDIDHPVPDEGFRLYNAMETPDSAVLIAEAIEFSETINPEKVEALVQVSFYDGNNLLGVFMHYKTLLFSKQKYVWDISRTGTQMKNITAFSINFAVAGDTNRSGTRVKVYDYKLYTKDSVTFHDPFRQIILDVKQEVIPTGIVLAQNYPNPFNPVTVIKFSSPQVIKFLKVYDVLGREVATLAENKPAGNYEVSFNGSNLASGPYVYVLQAGNTVISKKMILLK